MLHRMLRAARATAVAANTRAAAARTAAARAAATVRPMSTAAKAAAKPYRILTFNGDGVGREIVGAARQVLNATGVPIEWSDKLNIGWEEGERTGVIIGEEHLKAFEAHRVLFKGPLTIPTDRPSYVTVRDRKFTSANQVFRKVYDLYANVRPAVSTAGVATPFSDVDLVCFRENTEDVYTGEEKWVNADTVEGVKRISRKASARIAEAAFQYAVANGRRRVTCVHKANVCKQADGLFLATFNAVAAKYADKYPHIKADNQLADSLLTKLVQKPSQWDVLVCPNLYGDLVSDLAAGLVGSLGVCPSGQFGDGGLAVFEPCHGSAPDIASKGIANPVSQIRSGVMLLEHLGEAKAARAVEAAIRTAFANPQNLPVDLGGKATTQQVTDAIVKALKATA